MSNLKFEDITKIFQDGEDGIVAVDELNMEIKDGEFLVVVGPSGCGKTTTLRMVAGLETVTEGEIFIGDTPVSGKRPQERDIAMVFQSYALYPHMTVRENMSFGLKQSTALPDEEIHDRVEDAGEMLGIYDLLDRKPSELSGGQQQRVALGRAIVRDPDVFLMDEPLSNLDAKLRAEMRTELQQLQGTLETTTIYVTHDQTEAMTMSDRLVILDGGELQQIGTPMECYYEPNNRFVAGFIGEPSMNFIECSLERDKLITDKFEYELSERTLSTLDETTEITLGIRPENIEAIPKPSKSNDVPVNVTVVEPFGKENNLYLLPENENTNDTAITGEGTTDTIVATVDGNLQIEKGESVGMRFPEERLYLFDSKTGEALYHPVIQKKELTPIAD